MTGQHRTLPGPPDLVAAAALWEGYAAAHPDVVTACPDHTVERFGDSEELADELLGLVLAGEGDLSLESWRREHRRCWTRSCAARGESWSQDQEIVLDRFVVVWPPEHADPGA